MEAAIGASARMELGACSATDGPFDGATIAIAAVKPCAFGTPLRGPGA
jgi:hypothetical protein